jgi:Nif-specific regulatory protein
VFIDELGELPLAVQGRLLRVLQERAFERVGGTETVKVDVRIIAATNRDLEWMVQEGRFRADLYYRIRVVEVALPPLRERGESDIRRLVAHFVSAAARRHGLREPQLTEAAIRRLVAHSWPGNVRELENCIESAVVLVEGEVLDADTLPLPARSVAPVPSQRLRPESSLEPFDSSVPAPLERPAVPVRASGSWARPKPAAASELEADLSRADLSLAEVERRHILKVLDVAAQNRTVAARLLGIGRNTLIRKLKDFGFQEDGDG